MSTTDGDAGPRPAGPRRISGVILAAGSSRRLGRPKQLLELRGRPLLQHVIDAAAGARLDEIVVVLGHEATAIAGSITLPPNARIVTNPDHAQGLSTSLRVAIGALDPGSEAVVLLLGDQPLLSASAIRRVVDAYLAGGAPMVRTLWQGVPGHPVIVARSRWPELETARGDKGARDLLAAAPGIREIEMGAPPVADVDTWEEYLSLLGDPTEPGSARGV